MLNGRGVKHIKAIVGMICITVLAGLNMAINGDGTTLIAATALTGVEIGAIAQKQGAKKDSA